MRDFRLSIFFALVCLFLAAVWGFHGARSTSGIWPDVSIALILGIMEISLSFDSAVVIVALIVLMTVRPRLLILPTEKAAGVAGLIPLPLSIDLVDFSRAKKRKMRL